MQILKLIDHTPIVIKSCTQYCVDFLFTKPVVANMCVCVCVCARATIKIELNIVQKTQKIKDSEIKKP